MNWLKWTAATLIVAASSSSFGIVDSFVLTHNGATYAEGNLRSGGTNDNNGAADFSTANGVDQLSQNWWWFRFGDDGREFALSNQVFSEQLDPSSIRLVYRERDVIFDLQYTLTALSPDHARLQAAFKIENIRNTNVNVDFFSYTDYDLNNTFANDSGFFTDPNFMDVYDGASTAHGTLTSSGTRLVGWEMRDWPSLLNRLSNGAVTNLNNGSDPNPLDWTGAFQWRVNLTPANSGGFSNQFVGSLVKDIYTPVPEPTTCLALALGVVLLARRRRKG